MLQLFGLTLPAAPDREAAQELALRMRATAASLQGAERIPAAVAASVRADVLRYLEARRRGELQVGHAIGRACDTSARALLALTVDAPPVAATGAAWDAALMVA